MNQYHDEDPEPAQKVQGGTGLEEVTAAAVRSCCFIVAAVGKCCLCEMQEETTNIPRPVYGAVYGGFGSVCL